VSEREEEKCGEGGDRRGKNVEKRWGVLAMAVPRFILKFSPNSKYYPHKDYYHPHAIESAHGVLYVIHQSPSSRNHPR
jgi:hypothetical protein